MLTNPNNNVLYIGLTNDLSRRVTEHRKKNIDGFTKKYNLCKLVYYEEFEHIYDAISREKQLKNWHRAWKNNLVELVNKNWEDLSEDL
ncbi:GIY-YIG nuclease [Candidatus Parcubacteria bacterium]|nr:MAG: GIY-YIG nuclease [Candidatus Parcubacteria bacterium]